MAYRDSLEGVRSNLVLKRAEIEQREKRITPVLRALLPKADRDALSLNLIAVRGMSIETTSMTELIEMDQIADKTIAAYEAIDRRNAEFRVCPLPPKPRANTLRPYLIEEANGKRFRLRLTDILLDLGIDAQIERIADNTYLSVLNMPDCLMYMTSMVERFDNLFTNAITIGIPSALEELVLSVELPYQRILRALGLKDELSVGVARFDVRFWIVGSELTRAVFTADLRKQLLSFAESASPTLHFREGVARIEWKDLIVGGQSETYSIEQAIRLMRAIRDVIKTA